MLRSISCRLSVVAVLGLAVLFTDAASGQTRNNQSTRLPATAKRATMVPSQRPAGKIPVSEFRPSAQSLKGAIHRTAGQRSSSPLTVKREAHPSVQARTAAVTSRVLSPGNRTVTGKPLPVPIQRYRGPQTNSASNPPAKTGVNNSTRQNSVRLRIPAATIREMGLDGKVREAASQHLSHFANSSTRVLAGRAESPAQINTAKKEEAVAKRLLTQGLGIRLVPGDRTFPRADRLSPGRLDQRRDRASRFAKNLEGFAESINSAANVLDATIENASELDPESNSHDSHLRTMNPRDQIVDEWLPHEPAWLYSASWAATSPMRTGSGIAPLADSIVAAVVTDIPGKKDQAIEDTMDAFREVFEDWLFEGPGYLAPYIMSPGVSPIQESGPAESPWGNSGDGVDDDDPWGNDDSDSSGGNYHDDDSDGGDIGGARFGESNTRDRQSSGYDRDNGGSDNGENGGDESGGGQHGETDNDGGGDGGDDGHGEGSATDDDFRRSVL